MRKKRLIVMAPDGEFKFDGEFDTIEEAWDHSNDLGSKWYFYPVHFVVGEKGKKILDAPDDFREFIGLHVKTLQKWMPTIYPELAY